MASKDRQISERVTTVFIPSYAGPKHFPHSLQRRAGNNMANTVPIGNQPIPTSQCQRVYLTPVSIDWQWIHRVICSATLFQFSLPVASRMPVAIPAATEGCVDGMSCGRELCPQYRHRIAASCISSAHHGHFFMRTCRSWVSELRFGLRTRSVHLFQPSPKCRLGPQGSRQSVGSTMPLTSYDLALGVRANASIGIA